MNAKNDDRELLRRIAEALERLAPPPSRDADFSQADAFVWLAEAEDFAPVPIVNRQPLVLLKGIDQMRDTLLENTERFARGLPANNALLWGARGMGKSSLVKAVHGAVAASLQAKAEAKPLKLIEIHREDIDSLPGLLAHLREASCRFILFCDDLSFESQDTSYKSLKAVLEGGVEGRPDNVLFYATSNRRHLLSREMIENEQSTAINSSDAVEESVSLSDRFGLWLGFHNCSQAQYLEMIGAYATHYGLDLPDEVLQREALAWAMTRGSRSGRVAWQYIQSQAGRLGTALPPD